MARGRNAAGILIGSFGGMGRAASIPLIYFIYNVKKPERTVFRAKRSFFMSERLYGPGMLRFFFPFLFQQRVQLPDL